MNTKPLRFIEESIEAQFNTPPLLDKKPGSPDAFIWKGTSYTIIEVLNEWVDYRRKGRMARNMMPTHSITAGRRGSWGVGVFYYRVRTANGQIFDIYYDRLPKDVDHRKGEWFIYQELSPDY